MDTALRVAQIAFECLGFGILIFKGGRYLGQTNEMFLGIFRSLKRLEDTISDHIHDDDKRRDHVNEELSNIRVSIAGIRRAEK